MNLMLFPLICRNSIRIFLHLLFLALIDYSIVQEVIPSSVTPEENNLLYKVPDFEEVRRIVFEMNALSALGPDGLTRKIFQHYWDVVWSDVVSTVQQFYYSGYFHLGLNSSFLILIPKVDNAIFVDQFCPITLGNFLFKVIIEILADYLG